MTTVFAYTTMPPSTRPILWVNAARKEFDAFPAGARLDCAMALTIAADGGMAQIAKPMRGLGVFKYRLKRLKEMP